LRRKCKRIKEWIRKKRKSYVGVEIRRVAISRRCPLRRKGWWVLIVRMSMIVNTQRGERRRRRRRWWG
jgi:hypothetical protein